MGTARRHAIRRRHDDADAKQCHLTFEQSDGEMINNTLFLLTVGLTRHRSVAAPNMLVPGEWQDSVYRKYDSMRS